MQTDAASPPCAKCPPSASLAGSTLHVSTRDGLVPVRVERTLAEGGMGVVHAASAPGFGPLAIKVLHERHAGDRGIARRFEREAEHASRLRHPHVVAVLGSGRLPDGRPFFAMERLAGATLGAIVRVKGPLDIPRGLRLADQLLAGLSAVHQGGLVHRDLSPDNVFVAEGRGDHEEAVLLDFGFAQAPGVDTGDGVTPDSPGSLVGTLTFMAPEQATRGRAITERSDLFAAAVLLYYAFSGKLPFRGHDDLDVLVSVVRAQPVPLRRERRDAPAALDEVLSRALAKHPDARFSCAPEMRAALAAVSLSDGAPAPSGPRWRRGLAA